MDDRYDIYLIAGCARFPLAADLVPSVPALATPEVLRRVTEDLSGWLGLTMSRDTAEAVFTRLRAAGASGDIVPIAYRAPRLSGDDALRIAQQTLPAVAARAYPGYGFGPVAYWREEPRWWIFGSASPQLVAQGHVPGGVLAYVDKLDGHLWAHEEMTRLAR